MAASSIRALRTLIREMLQEAGLTGSLRKAKGKPQYKIGKVDDENQELSWIEAEAAFPGSTDAWAEIVPEVYPEFPFTEPNVIKRRTLWFRIGNKLRVAFSDMPQIELMEWDPAREDWMELDPVPGN
jgi:hypothetical protein